MPVAVFFVVYGILKKSQGNFFEPPYTAKTSDLHRPFMANNKLIWRLIMEIERKFLVDNIPDNLNMYKCRLIEQGYLSTQPVVRVRQDNDEYYLTYKGEGLLAHEEYNLPLTKEAYEHLLKKADGNIITKKRYEIPDNQGYTIELDIFEGAFKGTVLAEVEFSSVEDANSYTPPEWFKEDVTMDKQYHNSNMSKKVF